ncbi:MAG: matrixin family metalloprotease [Chloroflexi bacterium]|nr:matrixin family metalloprotease [Chloroflexota bacterium]
MKRLLVLGLSLSALAAALVIGRGWRANDDGLALSVESIKPGVTCPVNADNGVYKLDRWKADGALTYTNHTANFPAGAAAAIAASFATWEATDVPDGTFVAGTPATGPGAVGLDSENAVFFAPLGGSTIATTYVWYNRATRKVVEFDMVFNSNLAWEALSGSGDCVTSTSFDVQDIATHEIGHVVGVAHTSPNGANNAQSMYPYGQAGELYKRSLGDGDVAGANAKY